jgi:hypothetical protein
MEGPVFTGKFLKPAEAFSLQDFDPTHLYRLPENLLFWLLVFTAICLGIHFALSSFPGLRGRRGAHS